MKVIFSIASLEGGGAEKVLVDLVNDLCRYHEVTVQTIYNTGLYREQLDPRVTYRTIVKKPSLNKMRVVHRLITWLPPRWTYRLLVGGGYDAAVAFLEGISSKMLCGGKDVKKIAWIHTNIKPINPKIAGFRGSRDQAECYARYDEIVCVSKDVSDAFVEAVHPPRPPRVIYNPIHKDVIEDKASQPVSIPPKQGFVFCAIGRLVPVKAFDRVIRAIASLNSQGRDCSLWLLGEGIERERLESSALEAAVRDKVIFLGFQENPYPFLAACDVFVSSSLHEGYPLSVAEALVLKRPVIATLCSGSREILQDGAYGMVVENSDEGVYRGMKAVLDAPGTLKNLQSRAKQGAASFDKVKTMKQVYDLFDSL